MGAELACRAVLNGETRSGKLLLETDELIFRGGERLVIPLSAISEVKAESGRLTVAHQGRLSIFELGDQADKWARRIANPKTLIDKLGVRAGQKVVVRGLDDGFVAQLTERGADVRTRLSPDADAIFFAASRRSDLDRLSTLKRYLKSTGALWVVRPKGSDAISERDVLSEGKRAGLVDVKVVRFSATHTAEKFVVPVKDRRG